MNLPLSYYAGSSLVNAITSFGLAYLLLRNNSSGKTSKTFAMTAGSVGFWAWFYFLWLVADEKQSAEFFLRTCMVGVAFIPSTFFHFVTNLTDRQVSKRLLQTNYLTSGFIAVIMYTPHFAHDPKAIMVFPFWLSAGPLFPLHLLHFAANVLLSEFLLFQKIKQSDHDERNRLLLVFIGTSIGFFAGMANYPIWYGIRIPPMLNILVSLYVICVFMAIVKYRLLDITIVIRRALIYSILTACITVGYFLVVFAAQQAFVNLMGYQSFFLAFISALVLAVTFIPIKERIQSLVDRFFFRKSHLALAEENAQLWQEVTRTEQLRTAGTLASGVVHELRNPLTSVQTFCEMMPERHADPSFRAKFQAVVPQELRRIQGILEDLLAFARPRALKLETVALPKLIQETLDLLSYDFLRRRIALKTHFAMVLPIQADPTRVKQVVLNLVLNSLQAMGTDGTLTVWVSPDGAGCCLTIADTGPGLSPEIQARLGEPFLTTRRGGTGLGLPVVQALVEQHGGTVQFTSQAGIGTTVRVWWPWTKNKDQKFSSKHQALGVEP